MTNFKNGVIRSGSFVGLGKALGNLKDGIVREGRYVGFGKTVGEVSDYKIKGMEGERDSEMYTAPH